MATAFNRNIGRTVKLADGKVGTVARVLKHAYEVKVPGETELRQIGSWSLDDTKEQWAEKSGLGN